MIEAKVAAKNKEAKKVVVKKEEQFTKLKDKFEEEQKKAAIIEPKVEAKNKEPKKAAMPDTTNKLTNDAKKEKSVNNVNKHVGHFLTPAQEARFAKLNDDSGIVPETAARKVEEQKKAAMIEGGKMEAKKMAARKVDEQKKAAMIEAEKMEAKKMAAKKVQAQKEKGMNNMNKHVVHFLTPAQEARFAKLNEDSDIDDEGSSAPTAAETPPTVEKEKKVEEQKKPKERNQASSRKRFLTEAQRQQYFDAIKA